MHAGRHKQDGPDVPVEVDPKNILDYRDKIGFYIIFELL